MGFRGRPRAGGGAVSHFDGQFLASGAGMVMSPEMALQVGADAAADVVVVVDVLRFSSIVIDAVASGVDVDLAEAEQWSRNGAALAAVRHQHPAGIITCPFPTPLPSPTSLQPKRS